MNFPVFLATKYLKPKRSVASVITCVSILGVMLGVAAVIIVRRVMTGFGDEWEKKILSFKPHISILPVRGNVVAEEDRIAAAVRAIPGVSCVTPEVDTRILLSHGNRVLAPVLLGVDAGDFTAAYKIGAPRAGTFDLDGDSIVLGVHAARQLGCWVGDEVTVYSPKTLASQDEVYLPIKWKVVGIFSCGQYDYDSGYAVASLANVRDLMGLEKGVFAIHVKTDCPTDPAKFRALVETVVETANSSTPPLLHSPTPVRALTWREADRELFSALAVEKNMTAVLLLLISLVALFCVMNTLLVLTVQKTPRDNGRFHDTRPRPVHGGYCPRASCELGRPLESPAHRRMARFDRPAGLSGVGLRPCGDTAPRDILRHRLDCCVRVRVRMARVVHPRSHRFHERSCQGVGVV